MTASRKKFGGYQFFGELTVNLLDRQQLQLEQK
jgi:hypothetical protein